MSSHDTYTYTSSDGEREKEKDDVDAIHHAAPERHDHNPGHEEAGDAVPVHDLAQQTSMPDLRKVASNTLSRVASRLTTRDIADPGPPPDGGLKAWTQVAMGWIICVCTW
jgi:hypothetical protein